MNVFQRLLQQPQRVWARRALFQVHLWTGIAVGLYILVVSVSGSIVVFRSELYNYFTVKPIMVEGQSGEPLSDDRIKAIAEQAYPGFTVGNIFRGRRVEQAIEVWMDRGDEKKQRSFHPFTGEDLGDSIPPGIRVMSWMLDLHDNLLGGDTGRFVNGIGGIFLLLLCLTGGVIWWPGILAWRQSLMVRRKVGWKRLNWDLHSALGFWFFLLVFIWGITGVYLSMPNPFNATVDYFEPWEEVVGNETRVGDDVLLWFGRLHFGRYYGIPMKIAWTILGLVPAVLFFTGAIMWWNRVLLPRFFSKKRANSHEEFA